MLRFSLSTDSRVCFTDITSRINELLRKNDVDEGLCCIFIPHTTAAVTINEKADPGVMRDMTMALNKLVPFDDDYRHLEGNSAAHVKASLIGVSEVIPVENKRLVLGTWQAVFFCEFDGPRTRNVMVKII